jgi:hypothetical protein
MKKLAILCILLTSCTTVYKVDDKGVCRDPKGKIVQVPEPDTRNNKLYKWYPYFGRTYSVGNGSGGPNSQFRWQAYMIKSLSGSTAFGWW